MASRENIGDVFGLLTVTGTGFHTAPAPSSPGGVSAVLAVCSCGSGEKLYRVGNLRAGFTKSCGCTHRTHGLSGHDRYAAWGQMVSRCENPSNEQYKDYGGRGIKVCPEWHDVATFIADIERLIGPRPDGMTLDRIDNNGNYEQGNVRWADSWQQAHNKQNPVAGCGTAYGYNNHRNNGETPCDTCRSAWNAYHRERRIVRKQRAWVIT